MDSRSGRIHTVEAMASMSEDDKAHMMPIRSRLTRLQKKKRRIGRNDPCPCQSGKKFKHCHLTTARDITNPQQ